MEKIKQKNYQVRLPNKLGSELNSVGIRSVSGNVMVLVFSAVAGATGDTRKLTYSCEERDVFTNESSLGSGQKIELTISNKDIDVRSYVLFSMPTTLNAEWHEAGHFRAVSENAIESVYVNENFSATYLHVPTGDYLGKVRLINAFSGTKSTCTVVSPR